MLFWVLFFDWSVHSTALYQTFQHIACLRLRLFSINAQIVKIRLGQWECMMCLTLILVTRHFLCLYYSIAGFWRSQRGI